MVLLTEFRLKDFKPESKIYSDFVLDVEGYTGQVEIKRLPFLTQEFLPKLKSKYEIQSTNALCIHAIDSKETLEPGELLKNAIKHNISIVNWDLDKSTVDLVIKVLSELKDLEITLVINDLSFPTDEGRRKIIDQVFRDINLEGWSNITTLVVNLGIFVDEIEDIISPMCEFIKKNKPTIQLIPDAEEDLRTYPTLEPAHKLETPKLITLVSGNYPIIYDQIAEIVKSDLWITDARMINTDIGRELDVYGKYLSLETITMRNTDEYLINEDGMYVVAGEVYHIYDDEQGPQLVILDDKKQKLIKVPKGIDVYFLSIQDLNYVEKLMYSNITVINTKNEYISILLK